MAKKNCSVCGVSVGYSSKPLCTFCKQPKPEVGMGLSFGCWTDRHPGTITSVSPSGKTITVQEDRAIRTDKNGMSELQEYRFERNPSARVMTFRLTSRKGHKAWRSGSYTAYLGVRSAYHDFSF